MKVLSNIKTTGCALVSAVLMMAATQVHAQVSGFHSTYFANQYLTNPAMAGMEKGLNLNLGYQSQWTTLPGGPKLQNITADYNSGDRVGLGVAVNADQAGLINRTRAMATFAYHLPLSDQNKLSFGLSAGINDTYVDYAKIIGDAGDTQAANFNNRTVYVDGDFGIAFTNKNLTVQGAIPNLKTIFFPDQNDNLEVDRVTFFTAASYKFDLGQPGNTTIEPKLAYRGVKGFDSIFDAGFNLDLKQYSFSIQGFYHNNQTLTAGIGLDLKTTELLFAYTNNTGPLSSVLNNTFEFGVKLKLFNK